MLSIFNYITPKDHLYLKVLDMESRSGHLTLEGG